MSEVMSLTVAVVVLGCLSGFVVYCRCLLYSGDIKTISTQKKQDIWIYKTLTFNIVLFQLHTLVSSRLPVNDTR